MFLYFIFIILPSSVERFIVVVTGCLYPIAASIVAVTTDMANDDTQWLVYWCRLGVENELQSDVVAAMASTRCCTVVTPSMRPHESPRVS
jgi:hypothetical protein